MKNSRTLSVLGSAGTIIFILALVAFSLGYVQISTKGNPAKVSCNNNGICENGEYNYNQTPETQNCPDCLPKAYPALSINQGSLLQIIGANSNLGQIFHLKSEGSSYRDKWASNKLAGYLRPEMGDVDGCGNKEIVTVAEYTYKAGSGKKATNYYDYKIFFFKDGNLNYAPDFESPAKFGYSPHRLYLGGVTVADVDNCGVQDEIILNKIWQVEIYKYNGSDFELTWSYDIQPPGWVYGVSVGNADNDPLGTNELILATVDNGQAYIFSFLGEDAQGKFKFSPPEKTESMGNCYIDLAKVRDVDNDGLNEIIGCGNNSKLMVWKYIDGTYKKVYISDSLGGYTEEIDAGDIDGDGNKEIAIWATGVNTIYFFEYFDQNPSDNLYGTFIQKYSPLKLKNGIKELNLGDIDQYGRDEIVFGGSTDGLWVYKYLSSQVIQIFQCVYGSPGGPKIK